MDRSCPQCQAPLPEVSGYPDWCDACGWNLKPPPRLEPPAGRFDQIASTLGRRSGERMARRLLQARELKPRWTPERIGAYAIALAFHLLTLALVVGGIAAIVVEFPNVVSILIGVTMLAVGLLVRPQFDKLDPDDGYRLDADQAPALHELVAEVASALDREPPAEIRISAQWNASWHVVGFRRRRVLTLGMPLIAVLEPRERVALLAHEVGHDRNGDAREGLIVGTAVLGLDRLSALLQPPQRASGEAPVLDWDVAAVRASGGLARWLMWLVSRPVDAALWLEARLLLRDMQRAEYFADARAAEVAGSAATIALHERLLLWSAISLTIQHASHEDATDVLDRLYVAVQLVPDRERERRRRVARLESTRLEDTHPPTGMRIALVEGRAAVEPKVVLGEQRSRQIDAELAPFADRVDRELLDTYRGGLYYG
jgi:Zn-dependent protease with chaperone function